MKKLYFLNHVLFSIICVSSYFVVPVAHSQENKLNFELLHMWTTKGEQSAINVFKEEAIKRGVRWTDYAVHGNFGGIRESFSDRYALDTPPSAMQWIVGNELIQMVQKGTIRMLPNQWRGTSLDQIFIDEVLEIVKMEGGISAIPIGVHIQNHIVYNNKILAQLNATPAKNWSEFLLLAQRANEANIIPLAMSDQRWQMRNLFSSMLVEVMDHEEWVQLISRDVEIETFQPKFETAFGYLLALKPYADKKVHDRHWEDVSKLVVNDKAMAQVLGDYVRAVYPENDDFTCDLAPGNQVILWGVDSIAIVKTDDEAETRAQNIVIDVILDPEHYAKYNSFKGGIPVIKNLPVAQKGVCVKTALDRWNSSKKRIWIGGDKWQLELEAIGGVVNKVWNTNGITARNAANMLVRSLNAISK